MPTHGYIGSMSEIGIYPTKVTRQQRHWFNKTAWANFRSSSGARRAVALSMATKADDAFVLNLVLNLLRSAPVSIPGLAVRVKWVLEASKVSRASRLYELLEFLAERTLEFQHSSLEPKAFAWAYQVCSLIRKYPFTGNEDASRRAAISSFWQAEIHNLDTSARWAVEEDSGYLETLTRRLHDFLGPCPTWDNVIDRGDFGPGTNQEYNLDGALTGAEFKLASRPVCFARNTHLASLVIDSIPGWRMTTELLYGINPVEQVLTSSMFTVPKDAKTDRTAFKEPLIESFLQKGIAAFLRDRFSREGRDLSYSWRTCHQLARLGSITDLWCTVDLKSASDSITTSMLASLFTTDSLRRWFEMMDKVRSKAGICLTDAPDAARFHRFILFSSMGNAYTFELESALFYCVLTSIIPGIWCGTGSTRVLRWPHVAVFGDDLVFPAAYADRVVSTLGWLGFRVNAHKSFFKGSFRESCGRDFNRGWDVRPLFITKRLENGEAIKALANGIYHHGSMFRECPGSSRTFTMGEWKATWSQVVAQIPTALRLVNATPPGVPGGLWVGSWEATNSGPSGSAWNWNCGSVRVPLGALDAVTNPVFFRVTSVSSKGGSLLNMCLYNGHRGIAANGENLLQARLRPPTPSSWYVWDGADLGDTVVGEGYRRRQDTEVKVVWTSFTTLPVIKFPGFTENLRELIPIDTLVVQ